MDCRGHSYLSSNLASRRGNAALWAIGSLGILVLAGLIVLAANLYSSEDSEETPPIPVTPVKKAGNVADPPTASVPSVTPKENEPAPGEKLRHEAEFLGVRARGNRFCIVADCSNSMKGRPFEELKEEAAKTLRGLHPASQFYLLFFEAKAVPMPFPSWLTAEADNVEKAVKWVNHDVKHGLGTVPTPALKLAFKLEPKADVIFFMTDGLMAKTVPTDIARLNTPPQVIIHTIMFAKTGKGKKVDPSKTPRLNLAEDQLKLIAAENRGLFRHFSSKEP